MTRTNNRALANTPHNYVSVLDYGAVGDGVTDDTAAIQAAFGGAGTTPDNTHIYFPDGHYKISSTIKVYRSGQVLKNVSMVGESASGVFIEQVNPIKGFIFGEPSAADGLGYGNGTGINLQNLRLDSFSHKFSDMGLWLVFVENGQVNNIETVAEGLVVLAVGNDATDDCANITVTNTRRIGVGRNTSPDAWYSIGMYRVNGFRIDGYYSKYSPSQGTIGNHVLVAGCSNGTITNCVIDEPNSNKGINVEQDCTDVLVTDNVINGCYTGITVYSSTTRYNSISNNIIDNCDFGISVQAPLNTFSNNVITNSGTFGIQCTASEGTLNTFNDNQVDSYQFTDNNRSNTYTSGLTRQNVYEFFVPAVGFVQYYPSADGKNAVFDVNTKKIIAPTEAVRLLANIGPECIGGVFEEITFIFNRLGAGSINCYAQEVNTSGSSTNIGEQIIDESDTGIKEYSVVFGNTKPQSLVNKRVQALAIITTPGSAEFIGVRYKFRPTGQGTGFRAVAGDDRFN